MKILLRAFLSISLGLAGCSVFRLERTATPRAWIVVGPVQPIVPTKPQYPPFPTSPTAAPAPTTTLAPWAVAVVAATLVPTITPRLIDTLVPSTLTLPPPTAMPAPSFPTTTPQLPKGADYELVRIASGFQRPLYVTHAGDGSGRIFVAEQRGVIWSLQNGRVLSPPFLDIRDRVGTLAPEQGLLGLAFHPHYANNCVLFVHYSDRNGDTVVSRFIVTADLHCLPEPSVRALGREFSEVPVAPSSEEVVLTHPQPYDNHNGGQVSFGPDGYLYIGLGDGGSWGDPHGNGQNPRTRLGTILRIDVDDAVPYAVPPSNPFVSTTDASPEIWVYGLRNPWRFSFDRMTGDLYIGDVGQNDSEEIDFQPGGSRGGENYGWNWMEGNHCYRSDCNPAAHLIPVAEYPHSDGSCSVTGGYVYRGRDADGLSGVYLYGDYCSGIIWGLLQTAPGVWASTLLMKTDLAISSFGEDEAAEIYVVDHGGGIYWLKHVAVP